MFVRKIYAVIAAVGITGAVLAGLGAAAAGPPRWVAQAAAPVAVQPSDDLTGEPS